jgi:AraC-like DNA-binding protein
MLWKKENQYIKRSARSLCELECGAGMNLLRIFEWSEQDSHCYSSDLGILIMIPHQGDLLLKIGDGDPMMVSGNSNTWVVSLEHGVSLTRLSGASLSLVKISLSALERLSAGNGVLMRSFPAFIESSQDLVLENFVDALSEHCFNKQHISDIDANFCRAIATAVEHHVLKAYAGLGALGGSAVGTLATWQLQTVKEAMLARLETKLESRELAKMCGISTSHFRRAFFASTGMSVHRWVIRQRVEQVCGDLLNSSLPMADIALRWGFSDQSHLSRTFVAALGVTPAKWRQAHSMPTHSLRKDDDVVTV